MAYEFVAQGGALDTEGVGQYEGALAEGQRAILEIDLRVTPPGWAVDALTREMSSRGIPEFGISETGRTLSIWWRKGMPWLAIIVAGLLGLIVLVILVMGWRLFREVVGLVPGPLKSAMGLLLLLGLGLLVLGGGRKVIGGRT